MSEIVTRAGAGVPLTYTQVDSNFTNLNSTKLERDGFLGILGDVTSGGNTIEIAPGYEGLITLGMQIGNVSGSSSTINMGSQYAEITSIDYNTGAVTITSSFDATGEIVFDVIPVLRYGIVENCLSVSANEATFTNLTVNGTTTNINTTNLVIEDKNIVLGDTDSPTDITADGGGITLKATIDKTIQYDNTNSEWALSENVNVPTGKSFNVNHVSVLNETTLGSSVLNSSLTSVGNLTSLAVTGNLTVDTNTLYVDSSNNRVGIKTTPNATLDISCGDSSAYSPSTTWDQGIRLQDTNGGGTIYHSILPNGATTLEIALNPTNAVSAGGSLKVTSNSVTTLEVGTTGLITAGASPTSTANNKQVATTEWVRSYGGRQDAIIYTSGSGTVAFPAGVTKARVIVVGGGGGGGGAPAVIGAAGSGGAGGNTVIRYLNGITGSYTYSVGNGGTATLGANGGAGASSTFVCTDSSGAVSITAGGGGGGLVGAASIMVAGGAPSNTFTGGDIALRGIPGIASHYQSATAGQSSSGDGGGGYLGAGGGNGVRATSGTTLAGVAGQNGTGGGGSGGTNFTAVTAIGGVGGSGIIIIEY